MLLVYSYVYFGQSPDCFSSTLCFFVDSIRASWLALSLFLNDKIIRLAMRQAFFLHVLQIRRQANKYG